MTLSAEQRAAALREAATWVGTPWSHYAAIKGAGVDCVQFVVQVYKAIGAIGAVETGEYAQEWMLHRYEQRLIAKLEQYARPILTPMPADLAVYRYGRSYSHIALVVEWPRVVHANRDRKMVCYDDGEQGILADRDVRFWSLP